MIHVLFFAILMAIKGGLLGRLFKNWNRAKHKLSNELKYSLSKIKNGWDTQDKSKFFELFLLPFKAFAKWFMDGSVISLFLVFIYVAMNQDLTVAVPFALGWVLLWSSMGEEAGAAGDYKGAWGPYMTASIEEPDRTRYPFGRSYGIKKGIQYGCFAGGVMALSTGSWCILFAAATFPLCYYLGSSFLYWRTKGAERGWEYGELLWGGVIGLGYALATSGWLPVYSTFTSYNF